MIEFASLLAGTVIYRPYVYAFLVCFLAFSVRHMRWRGALFYMLVAFLIAFLAEYSSTRNGFPFGYYVYIDDTRTRELWISNVPFWDSLSFVFLSYFSWILAASLRSPLSPSSQLMKVRTALLAGVLMMLLDVVIDPVTLQGEHWFLGRVYYYPDGGTYFGVTLANFVGWFIVGCAIPLVIQALARLSLTRPLMGNPVGWAEISRGDSWGCFGVYAGIFAFNLGISAWIGRWDLFAAGTSITLLTLGAAFYALTRTSRSATPPPARARPRISAP